MKNTLSKLENKKIAIFGAGKIGRSFIAQLFSRAGYMVVFIDINQTIASELNRRQSYQVVIKSEVEQVLEIKNVSGISVNETDKVIDAVAHCALLAVSVGKNAFRYIFPVIAKRIERRYLLFPDAPLDIILAENMRDASEIAFEELEKNIIQKIPVRDYVGMVKTSIGKMVPIMPKEIEKSDPCLFNSLPAFLSMTE